MRSYRMGSLSIHSLPPRIILKHIASAIMCLESTLKVEMSDCNHSLLPRMLYDVISMTLPVLLSLSSWNSRWESSSPIVELCVCIRITQITPARNDKERFAVPTQQLVHTPSHTSACHTQSFLSAIKWSVIQQLHRPNHTTSFGYCACLTLLTLSSHCMVSDHKERDSSRMHSAWGHTELGVCPTLREWRVPVPYQGDPHCKAKEG